MTETGTVGIALVEAEKVRQKEWTLSQKVWELVKNHPDILARDVPKRLGRGTSSVSCLVNQQVRRGMLISTPETRDEFKRRKPTGAGRPSLKLRVSPELRGTYEWLPVLKPAAAPSAGKLDASPVKLEDLTIKQARTLYLELKELFGDA